MKYIYESGKDRRVMHIEKNGSKNERYNFENIRRKAW